MISLSVTCNNRILERRQGNPQLRPKRNVHSMNICRNEIKGEIPVRECHHQEFGLVRNLNVPPNNFASSRSRYFY